MVSNSSGHLVIAAVGDLNIRMVKVEICQSLVGIRHGDVKRLVTVVDNRIPYLIRPVGLGSLPGTVFQNHIGFTDRCQCAGGGAPESVRIGTIRIDAKLHCVAYLQDIGSLRRVQHILAVICAGYS